MADLFGETSRSEMETAIIEGHYSKSLPAGKSHYFAHDSAVVVFSIPANPFVGEWLLWPGASVWELSRLWAPDGHRRNLLTEAISAGVCGLRSIERVDAAISYADPNVGHAGLIYRAASWVYLGVVEESRYYRDPAGTVVSRRSFHSGSRHLRKAEILALGYTEERLPGRHRFARGFTRKARAVIDKKKVNP